jgi:hypothetical protein
MVIVQRFHANGPTSQRLIKHIHYDPAPTLSAIRQLEPNLSGTDHPPDVENGDLSQLSGSTRIVPLIAGIAITMRFLDSHNIFRHDLTPDNIHLDWD